MPNLRILYDNAADRATITASTTAGSLAASNLKIDKKSKVWRGAAATTTGRLTATWTTPESLGLMAIPFCNLSATATVQIRIASEGSVTNKILYSEVQSNAAYTKTATTIGSAITAPDGTNTALPVVDTAATSTHSIYQDVSLVSGTIYTFSMFVKATGRTRLQLQNTSSTAYVDFNLTTGLAVAAGGTGFVGSNIIALPNSWFRISLVFTSQATSTQHIAMYLEDASGNVSYLGNGTSGIYTWGWQVEANAGATSYYPTTSAVAVRPLGYIDSWQSYNYSSGYVSAVLSSSGIPVGVNNYSYGGGNYARIWFPIISAYGVAIDIIDSSNPAGYLEASRLVLGAYWEPTYNTGFGLPVTPIDTSTNDRSSAGDLVTTRGVRYRTLGFEIPWMISADLIKFNSLRKLTGKNTSIFVSLFPNDTDSEKENTWQIWGRQTDLPALTHSMPTIYSGSMAIEEF